MDGERTYEREWRRMVGISHDFFHRWRQAVAKEWGEEAAQRLEAVVWESVGEGTAAAFRARPRSLAEVVDGIARVSRTMGEAVEVSEREGELLLTHHGCPWPASYRDSGLPGGCRPGCDLWFHTSVARTDSRFGVETLSAMPDGDAACVRRFFQRPDSSGG